jgi:hypothetical protein
VIWESRAREKSAKVVLTCMTSAWVTTKSTSVWRGDEQSDFEILRGDFTAVPPPAREFGFDKPRRGVNKACHMRGDRVKCTLERAVELRRAIEGGLDLVQKFPQVHFSTRREADGPAGRRSSLDSAQYQPIVRLRSSAVRRCDGHHGMGELDRTSDSSRPPAALA